MTTMYPVPAEAKRHAEKHRRSIAEPEALWREESARIDSTKPWTRLSACSFNEDDFGIEWFADGTLNVSGGGCLTSREGAVRCADPHLL